MDERHLRSGSKYRPDPSDRIFLDRQVEVIGDSLTDQLTGRQVELTESAAGLSRLLDGRRLGELRAEAARQGVAQEAIDSLIVVLERDALVRIQRRIDLRPLLRGVLPSRPVGRTPARRHPATFLGALAAASRVSWLSILTALTVPLLLLAPNSSDVSLSETLFSAWPIMALIFAISATALFTVASHEFGHIAMMRRFGVQHSSLLRRGWRLSIRFKRSKDLSVSRRVAAAGPIAGALAALPGAALAWQVGLGRLSVIAIASIGLIHLINLLPFFADGRELWTRSSQ